jgi:HSP20 family protein
MLYTPRASAASSTDFAIGEIPSSGLENLCVRSYKKSIPIDIDCRDFKYKVNWRRLEMLLQHDPFRDFDRLTQQVFGTVARPSGMPLDAWREGDEFVVELDLPGIEPDKVDIDVERNVLTIRAERFSRMPDAANAVASERSWGVFSRQLVLGDALDTEKVEADYSDGVLRLRIPIAEQAKPRKISVGTRDSEGRKAKSISA